jgi:hypothetical protein
MSFFRSVLLASLISLLAALGLLFIGSVMGYEEFRSGYAVLITDDSIDDRVIRSHLESGEIFFSGSPISESSQWVLLDEFDSVKRIPLDQYSSRIFPFDPRNDGYAGKLKEVFLRDGKRFVYAPLFAGNWKTNYLDKKFNELMGDIPFSIEYYGIGRPLSLFFIVYAAASAILLILCYAKRKIHRSIVNIIPMIPVLSSLGFFGAAGIGSAALLFALFIMLKEPLNDLVNPPPLIIEHGHKFKTIYKEIIAPYRFYWLFIPVSAAGLSILVIFSQLKLLFLIAVTAASFAVFFISLKIVSFSGVEHRRFNPLMILRRRFPEFVFPMYILPFVIGAFMTMFFTPYMSGSYDTGSKFDVVVTEQDYYEHLTYQMSFSTRKLGASSAVYPAFSYDTDGLVSMNKMNAGQSVRMSDFPSFPLKQLMDFFNNVNNGDIVNSGKSTGRIQENLSLLVLLLFLFPGLFFMGKSGISGGNSGSSSDSGAFDGLKKNSGKSRLMGINWNNKLLYNNKSILRSRKDA